MTEQTIASSQDSLAIVGGGITGLSAAYYALKNGQAPNSITVYEGSDRLGGKIKTGYFADGTPVNMGAEFIDSEHEHILALCKELGVPLKSSDEQSSEIFQRADGSSMKGDDFHTAYKPLAERIIRDKAIIARDPKGELAQRINNMSLNDYLLQLRAETPRIEQPSFLRRLFQMFTGDDNHVSPEIATMAMQAFASEVGQPPEKINALQFLNEASGELGSFLDSDCAFRVEGGTENLIKALEKHLKEKGVNFVQQVQLKSVSKETNGTNLSFENGSVAHASKVVMALPAYALGKVEGMQSLGLTPDIQKFIGETQYTNSVKFTIKLKPGAQVPGSNFFSRHGFQVWSSGAGELTFLVQADKLQKMSPTQMIDACISNYARTNNIDPDTLFERKPENIIYNNPGKNPCYASPAPGKAQALNALTTGLDGLAANGIAIAGTYLPHEHNKQVSTGFMECGAAASMRAIDRLVQPEKERPLWLEQTLSQTRGQSQSAGMAL